MIYSIFLMFSSKNISSLTLMVLYIQTYICRLIKSYKGRQKSDLLVLLFYKYIIHRNSHLEVFLRKGVLKICSKFTGEYPCRSVISINLQSNFIEVALQHRCSPLNLLHYFRTLFSGNTSGWMFLN